MHNDWEVQAENQKKRLQKKKKKGIEGGRKSGRE